MLNDEQRTLVEENIKLVYYMANKLGYRDEDSIQYGLYGLCKAAETYDKNKGMQFSTYACSNISRWLMGTYSDIKYYKQKSQGNLIDLDDLSYIISEDDSEEIREQFNDVMQSASPKLRLVFELIYNGYSRKEISQKIGKSQPTISRWISEFREEYNGRNQEFER